MVCYCCVKGCKNNSNTSKKDSCSVSFHAFPSNPEMRRKWLRAIGRPNWDPPNHVRICSAHFSHEKVNQDGYRTRIRDDACPVKDLPLNSNFEATHLEVCRICLATDTRMYSLTDETLMMQFEAISGFNEKCNIEGLPQFICYLCRAILMKCYNLIEKSMATQAILLDIFAENGQITKNLLKKQDRKSLTVISTLCSHYVTPSRVYEYLYNNDNNTSILKTTYLLSGKEQIEHLNDIKKIDERIILNKEIGAKFKTENSLCVAIENNDHKGIFNYASPLIEPGVKNDEIMHDNAQDNFDEFDAKTANGYSNVDDRDSCSKDSLQSSNSPLRDTTDTLFNREENCNFQLNQHEKCVKETSKKKKLTGLTPDEINMEKYFNIVKLDLHQQLEDWKKSTETPDLMNRTMYTCDVCRKSYASVTTLKNHMPSHDPSRGPSECPVCKRRFRNEVLMASHSNRMHGKKFHCKSCPKTFSNVSVAKKHERWHAGHLYKCTQCSFASVHSSALSVHARSQHARGHSCVLCGHSFVSAKGLKLHFATAHRGEQDVVVTTDAYVCLDCDISFKTEGARRVHILTSKFHKEKTVETPLQRDPSLRTTCKWCGSVFATVSDMTAHARTEHRRPIKKTTWRLPGDSYPTQCDHCSQTVNSRQEHWWHVRKQHPGHRGSYRAVITAVCHTCGKGFQNSTKLRMHLLRHSSARFACDICSRVLHDPYALARHRAAHRATRMHRCALCSRAFALKANLVRHARVHTGVTPYECNICGKKFKYSTSVSLHVRTVHHRLPHPPRKKRTKDKPDSDRPHS